jgi:tetratricopeptide (TPR) repeat protein
MVVEIVKVAEEFVSLVLEGKPEEAHELVIKESEGRENELADWLRVIGIEQGESGNHFAALHCFECAAKIVKLKSIRKETLQNLVIAHTNYASLLFNMKRFEDAENHYKEALRLNPDYAEVHFNYANLLFNMKRFEDAENHYKEALRLNPDDAEVHNNYANLLSDMKRFEDAENHYKEALRLNPDDAEVHFNYASLLSDMKRFEDAENHYKEALRLNPDDAEVHNNYANLLSDMKRFEDAENHYKEALRLNPDYAEVHFNYASLLFNMKRFEDAENHYKEALRLNPDYAEASANFGVFWLKRNELGNASRWFQNAKSLFEKQDKNSDVKKMEAFTDWITARKIWESFSFSREDTHSNLEKSKEHYSKAAIKFREINSPEVASFLEFISEAIFISKEYLQSLNSQTLAVMRDTMNRIHERFLPSYEEIKKISFPDIDLLRAQFICIDTLKKCLNFEDVHTADLHEASHIFGTYNFREPFQATTALENVANEFKILKKLYKTVEEIPQEKQEELLKMMKPFSVYDSIITKRMDEMTREKSITPYELREIIREAVSPIVRASEERIISQFKTEFEKYHHELVRELEALTDAQLLKFKEVISERIEEDIEKVEDQEKKETLRNRKRAYDTAKDIISILGGIASIYSVLTTRPEEAMNEVARIVSIALSIIKKSSDMI